MSDFGEIKDHRMVSSLSFHFHFVVHFLFFFDTMFD